ncbi:DUF2306 domain-containing protein [Paracrocinitomix mangrovi]|uniref:DUF2306 domain-containing protein n=1 Tax=Paracrocinitomix mangrovi TaxID=2862509 RepID=UPI001EDC1A4B|nr:DUF2306 domain-containing protein [Paracrocinitomix mangrovi]UKN03875.1 DUF2306 domain-containing protein [Paracrocinitomix mangrovi]
MTLLAVFLFTITAKYLTFQPDLNFLLVKQDLIFDTVWRPTFYLHVTSGMIVILIGPFQFLKAFRNKQMKLHRLIGKIYAYGILIIAAPTGLIMAYYAEGGILSTYAFIIMSVLWFFTTLMAVITVKKKDLIGHQKWMYRSYALSFAAVTLRLLVPLMSEPFVGYYLGSSHEEQTYIITVATAWLSWIINLIVAEILIRKNLGKVKAQKN